ncbi:MAG: ATP synthase F1 subunit epsilon [Puniceicoccales bacterium]|jgi:F-type H+-transporting ATPase subunit epsilon|nr:ATP synthase F1 subunit epsilon [Puniceicoccales bacterium]
MVLCLEISTPEGVVLEAEGETVSVPTARGELTILPGHQPLAALVEPGILHYGMGGGENSLAVDGGFLLIQGDRIYVMVDQAVNVIQIDPSEAETARQRAEHALEEAKKNQADRGEIARLEAKIRYQIVKSSAKR